MKPVGTKSRAKRLARAGFGPRKRPVTQPAGLATSIEQFVRRAAADARSTDAESVELALAEQHHRHLFEPGSYVAVSLPPRAMIPCRLRQRLSVGGLPVASGRFGVAVCTGMLDHVAEPQSVLNELNRTLGPDGRLYLTSPLVVDPSGLNGLGRGTTRLGMNYLLEAAGFSLDELQTVRDSNAYAIVARKVRPSAVIGLRTPY